MGQWVHIVNKPFNGRKTAKLSLYLVLREMTGFGWQGQASPHQYKESIQHCREKSINEYAKPSVVDSLGHHVDIHRLCVLRSVAVPLAVCSARLEPRWIPEPLQCTPQGKKPIQNHVHATPPPFHHPREETFKERCTGLGSSFVDAFFNEAFLGPRHCEKVADSFSKISSTWSRTTNDGPSAV
jgi:hypothetical protein